MTSPGGRYRVSLPPLLRARLRAYARQAGAQGVLPEFTRELREINDKLETDPLGRGVPNYRLLHLNLPMCLGPHPLLFVYYGVDEQRRIVYIKGFHPAPAAP